MGRAFLHAAALLWAAGLVWLAQGLKLPFMPINVALIGALVPPGLVALAMALAAQLRAGTPALPAGLSAQLLLALALWPWVALTLGGQVALALGGNLALASLIGWAGGRWPALTLAAHGAALYATALAALWGLVRWAA